MELFELSDLYRRTLLGDVVPFWLQHAIDENGGINTCIRDNGALISRDRWNWSQWRAVWVFSKLFNSIEKRPEWIETAQGIFDFVAAHGPLDDGHWPLLLDGDGSIREGYNSIAVDGFAIYGLAELYRATHDDKVLALARRTFEAAQRALDYRLPPPAYPYPVPVGWINHGISMLFSLAYFELGLAAGDEEVLEAAEKHHRCVMDVFLQPESGMVLEWLREDGTHVDDLQGTACVPGHAIESMWFQMHIARETGDRATINRAIEAIRLHLERGWDPKHGGLFLAIDVDGSKEVGWPHAEKKLWWPHVEALYATILCYQFCKEDWCLEWHEKVRRWSFDHFPVADFGEWRQKLTREGQEITDTLVLPVKDPFHLPRGLIYLVETLGSCRGVKQLSPDRNPLRIRTSRSPIA